MGRHEGHDTFGAIADDYVTQRARELVRQFDRWQAASPIDRLPGAVDWDAWIGAAAEILRELTRDA